MKKIGYLSVIALGGLLLISGCGKKSHTLSCSRERENRKLKATIHFNDDNSKAESVEMELTINIGPVSNEEKDEMMKNYKTDCDDPSHNYTSCEVIDMGEDIVLKYSGKPADLALSPDKDIDESIEALEANGFTCEKI